MRRTGLPGAVTVLGEFADLVELDGVEVAADGTRPLARGDGSQYRWAGSGRITDDQRVRLDLTGQTVCG